MTTGRAVDEPGGAPPGRSSAEPDAAADTDAADTTDTSDTADTSDTSDTTEAARAGEAPVVHRRSTLRNAGSLLAGQATTWLITTIVMVIVPRLIGPEDMGSWRTATSVWAVAAMAMAFGTSTLLTLDVARRHTDATVRLGPILAARLFGFSLVLPVVFAVAWAFDYSDLVIVLLAIVAVSTLLGSVGEVAAASLTGLERLDPVATGDVISKLVAAALMIVAAVVSGDIRLVVASLVVSSAVSVAYLYRSLRRLKPVDLRTPSGSIRSAIRRGRPYFVIGVTLVAYNQVDVVIMSVLVSEVEIGWYGAADTLFGTMLFVPTIVMSALLPRLARADARDSGEATTILVQAFTTLTLFSVPIGLGIFVVARPLTELLYGPAYDGTGPVLAVFGIVLIFTFQTVLLGQHAVATGRQRLWNVVLLVAIPMTIVFDLIFVPVFDRRYGNGAIAGALAYILTEGMMVTVGIWKLAPDLLSRVVLRRVVKVLVAGGVMVAASWPLRNWFIAVPVVVGAVTYLVVLLALRPLEPHEQAIIGRLTNRVPGLGRLIG